MWIGQEPGWESPINRGSHCAKGASVRELVHGDRRLKYPMKLVNGQWTKVSWDTAINEIGDKMIGDPRRSRDRIRSTGSAPRSSPTKAPICSASSRPIWGTNNVDHQARICHSTTVAGVANTWGYGAMTNSYNDIRNSKTMIIMGGNPAEAHPVSLQHLLEGKELNRANYVVIEPRLTRTAAHATEYVRIRSGTDIPVIYGMLWHIFKNGWEDKQFIEQRVYGMDDIRKEVEKWNPEEVERVTGVPGAQLERVAKMFATEKPATLIWCMGATQHTVGTANVRAFCIALLATGNVGALRQRRQHLPRPLPTCRARPISASISRRCRSTTASPKAPGGIGAASGRSTTTGCGRFETTNIAGKPVKMMEAAGIPSTRWFDATMLPQGAGVSRRTTSRR